MRIDFRRCGGGGYNRQTQGLIEVIIKRNNNGFCGKEPKLDSEAYATRERKRGGV